MKSKMHLFAGIMGLINTFGSYTVPQPADRFPLDKTFSGTRKGVKTKRRIKRKIQKQSRRRNRK